MLGTCREGGVRNKHQLHASENQHAMVIIGGAQVSVDHAMTGGAPVQKQYFILYIVIVVAAESYT